MTKSFRAGRRRSMAAWSDVAAIHLTSPKRLVSVGEKLVNAAMPASVRARHAETLKGWAPAGAFYRALLWRRVYIDVAPHGLKNGATAKWREVCATVAIEPRVASQLAAQGRLIAELRAKGVGVASLVFASPRVFELAMAQRRKRGVYLRFVARALARDHTRSALDLHKQWCAKHGAIKANLDIIKPSDWWAFSHPRWRQDGDFPGSIPGEVYANALYYFAPPKGIAVDAMAGSGMMRRVYRDRRLWQKDSAFDLTIKLFDLAPRRQSIECHDARRPLPLKADWIFIDPPYFGQSSHLYEGILSRTKSFRTYTIELRKVIRGLANSLRPDGRLLVLVPRWSADVAGTNYDVAATVCKIASREGLRWIDAAYISRARQAEPGSGYRNIAAKRSRRLISDVCVLNVFERAR